MPETADLEPAPPTSAPRLGWVDQARGIAIVLVVYGHCFRGLRSAGLVAAGSPLSTLDYVIYCFHMPVFFFLSGLFGAASVRSSGRPFWRGRMLAVLHPYLLWMTIELLLLRSMSGLTNAGAVAIGPGTYLYAPVAPFWFLYALLACNLATHAVARLGRWPLPAFAVLAFAGSRTIDVEIVRLTGWGLLYFACGNASARAVRSASFSRALSRTWLLPASIGGTAAAGLLAHDMGVSDMTALPAAVTGALAVFCLAERACRLEGQFAALRLVSYLGRISLTVLVVHVLGTAATRIVLTRWFGVHAVGAHLLVGTLAGLALPLAVQSASMRLNLAGVLGLPRAAFRLSRPDTLRAA